MFRDEVFSYDGERYLGTVVYVRRRMPSGGSEYGWRPETQRRARLSSASEAILRLPRLADETTVDAGGVS